MKLPFGSAVALVAIWMVFLAGQVQAGVITTLSRTTRFQSPPATTVTVTRRTPDVTVPLIPVPGEDPKHNHNHDHHWMHGHSTSPPRPSSKDGKKQHDKPIWSFWSAHTGHKQYHRDNAESLDDYDDGGRRQRSVIVERSNDEHNEHREAEDKHSDKHSASVEDPKRPKPHTGWWKPLWAPWFWGSTGEYISGQGRT